MSTEVTTHNGVFDGLEEGRIRRIVDAVGVAPKLATLAMLDKTPDDYVSRSQISRRLNQAQGAVLGWDFLHDASSTPLYYCKSVLGPLGLVDIGNAPGVKGDVAEGARITPLGSAVWSAAAGAYIPWELDQRDFTLADVIGNSQQAMRGGGSLRADMLQFLNDRGSPASVTEINAEVGRSLGTVSSVAHELARIGLLKYTSRYKLEERVFELTDQTDSVERNLKKMLPETRAVFEMLLAARQDEGLDQINGLEIINRIKESHPELDPKQVWIEFTEWFQNPHKSKPFVIDSGVTQFGGRRVMLEVPATQEAGVRDFVERRRRLITDEDYRSEAAIAGRGVFSTKRNTSKILGNAKRDAKSERIDQVEWELLMLELVPPDGISVDELQDLVSAQTGKSMQRKAFRKMITKLDDMLEITEGRSANGVNITTIIRLRNRVYSKEWAQDARCLRLNIDPETFTPDEASQFEERRRRLADALFHCMRCPVRAPCLRSAVEDIDDRYPTNTVSGGLTPDQKRKLSVRQRARLLETVRIGNNS